MKKNIIKKNLILYILKIIQEGTDANHSISLTIITNTLNKSGINCSRKTVSRTIDYLKEYGYDIVRNGRGRCYFNSKTFEKEEIALLIKLLDNSEYEKKEQLKNKLKLLLNIYDRNDSIF